mgnify:CR=1 FL=1
MNGSTSARAGEHMNVPILPDVARSVLRGVIASLANAGLMTRADAEAITALLGLGNAFFDRDASLEIDRLTAENEQLRTGGGTR